MNSKFCLLMALLAALATSACTRAGLAAANLPTHFAGGVSRVRDVPFDRPPALALDIYRPEKANRPLPVVVFFYGGRWTYGDKAQYAFVGQALAEKGYMAVIPDYRKYPDVKFPAFAQDAAAAVAWTYEHAKDYGGDARRLFVAGHSSGAHLGALVASDPRYLQAYGLTRDVIKGFAGLAGPYAFTPDEPDLKAMFGPPENYARMKVTSFIDGREPPMLLLWGDQDTAVGRFNMERLAVRIRKNGGQVETKIYPGINHMWIVGALSWLGRSRAPVLDDMTSFFQSVP